MSYCVAHPSSVLSKFVKHYWAMDNCLPPGKEHIQRIVPNGLLELMFYFGDKPESKDKNKAISENTLVTGQLSGYYDIKVTGSLSLFSIIFQPHGLSMFFDVPVNEFYNQNVPLKFVLKEAVTELETKLFEANSLNQRIIVAETFLLKRLQKVKKKHHFERISRSIDWVTQLKGVVDIDTLASKACLSRKQYERVFLEYIGTSPKQFLKIVRFQNAINEKSKNRAANLTTLTYQCGYYDQSHMTNDFTKLSGMTPKQYFNDCEPYSDFFQ